MIIRKEGKNKNSFLGFPKFPYEKRGMSVNANG